MKYKIPVFFLFLFVVSCTNAPVSPKNVPVSPQRVENAIENSVCKMEIPKGWKIEKWGPPIEIRGPYSELLMITPFCQGQIVKCRMVL